MSQRYFGAGRAHLAVSNLPFVVDRTPSSIWVGAEPFGTSKPMQPTRGFALLSRNAEGKKLPSHSPPLMTRTKILLPSLVLSDAIAATLDGS